MRRYDKREYSTNRGSVQLWGTLYLLAIGLDIGQAEDYTANNYECRIAQNLGSQRQVTMASKYCLNCGYANDPGRGACLMCYAPLPATLVDDGQMPEAIKGMQPPPGLEAMAALVVEAVGEGIGGIGSRTAEADYGPEPTEDYEMVALESFDEAEAADERIEAPAEQPAEELEEAEEEYVPPPPPPGVVELEEEVGQEEVDGLPEQEEAPEKPAGGEWTINQQ